MYDLIIIWSGPAWLSAWVYAGRYKLKTLIIWELPGWIITQSHCIENYPGFESISGQWLMDNFISHAKNSWSEINQTKISEIQKIWNNFRLITISWENYETKSIIIATWNKYRKLWVVWEKEFIGAWVSYCATCDWMFFRNRDVAIVGWWNTAVTEALYLAEICNKVYIVHRRNSFSAEEVLIEKIKSNPKIELIMEDSVSEITWNGFVEKVILNSWKEILVNWVFIAVWSEPDTALFDSLNLEKDQKWFIVVDSKQKTSSTWVYAAWDITTWSGYFQQVIMAAAEWSLAANSVHEYILNS